MSRFYSGKRKRVDVGGEQGSVNKDKTPSACSRCLIVALRWTGRIGCGLAAMAVKVAVDGWQRRSHQLAVWYLVFIAMLTNLTEPQRMGQDACTDAFGPSPNRVCANRRPLLQLFLAG